MIASAPLRSVNHIATRSPIQVKRTYHSINVQLIRKRGFQRRKEQLRQEVASGPDPYTILDLVGKGLLELLSWIKQSPCEDVVLPR